MFPIKNFFLLIFSILVIILARVTVLSGWTLFSEILFSIFTFSAVSIFCLKLYDKVLSRVLFLGFLLRGFLAYLQRFVLMLPDSTADAVGFERGAWRTAEAWLAGTDAGVKMTGSGYYTRFLAWLYYFFGRVPLAAQFINVLLGTFLIFIVYKTVLVLFDEKRTARIAAFVTAFFPAYNLYSAITMREQFIVFPLAMSFAFFSYWLKKDKLRYFILALLFCFISGIYHGGVVFIAAGYLFVFSFYRHNSQKWVLSKRVVLGLFLGVFYFYLFFNNFHFKVPKYEEVTYETLGGHVVRSSRDRAAYLTDLVPKNRFDILLQTPIRVGYLFFAPFPVHIKNSVDVAGFLDAMLYLFLFVLFFRGIWMLGKRNKIYPFLFLFILGLFSVPFAWGTSNYGTGLRHRQKIAFLLIIPASFSLARIKRKRVVNNHKEKHFGTD